MQGTPLPHRLRNPEIVEKAAEEQVGLGDILDHPHAEKLTEILIAESMLRKLRKISDRGQNPLQVINRPDP